MPRKQSKEKEIDARDRILESATLLFSKKGFAGASVRDITKDAGVGVNMVNHYFGSKDGLFDEIIGNFSREVFLAPLKAIDEHPKSKADFCSRFELFVEQSLDALISQRYIFALAKRENVAPKSYMEYSKGVVGFLEASKKCGYVRKELDSEMLTGLIIDRLGNQVIGATCVEETIGTSILNDDKYKKRWLKANIDLFLNGMIK